MIQSFATLLVEIAGWPLAMLIDHGIRFRARIAFSRFSVCEAGVTVFGTATLANLARKRERVFVGRNTVIRGNLLVFPHGGAISIGPDSYIGEDTRIWSSSSIRIGSRVLISHCVNIHDTDSHPIDAKARHAHYQKILAQGHPRENPGINDAPVSIGDDVWIGFNATILKGVQIGDRSILAACSVITHDVPADVVVAGCPARVVREL